jgi:hypothetical protein
MRVARAGERLLEALGASRADRPGASSRRIRRARRRGRRDEPVRRRARSGSSRPATRSCRRRGACSRRRRRKARWSRSPARCARPRRCSSSPRRRRRRWPSPPTSPEGRDAERMVIDIGRRRGCGSRPTSPRGSPTPAATTRRSSRQELAKFALYVGASPAAPKELDHDASTRSAPTATRAISRARDMRWPGDRRRAARSWRGCRRRVRGDPGDPRAAAAAADAGARLRAGSSAASADAVMTSLGKSLFWKDKAEVERMLLRSGAPRIWRRSPERAGKLERELMFSPAPSRRRSARRGAGSDRPLFAIAARRAAPR